MERFFYELRQLEALGHVEIGLMHSGSRTETRFMYVTIRGVEIKDGAVLAAVSVHGTSVEECVRRIYKHLTTLPPQQYIVCGATGSARQAFRFDADFGSWVRVNEEAAAQREP